MSRASGRVGTVHSCSCCGRTPIPNQLNCLVMHMSRDEILAAGPEDLAKMRVSMRLGRAFAHASGNLVLLLIINGLRTQIPDPGRVLGGPPRPDPKFLKRIAAELKSAVSHRDAASAGSSMRELLRLMRTAAGETLRSHRRGAMGVNS